MEIVFGRGMNRKFLKIAPNIWRKAKKSQIHHAPQAHPFYDSEEAEIYPIILGEPADSSGTTQIIISDSNTKDFLIKGFNRDQGPSCEQLDSSRLREIDILDNL